MTTRGYTFLFFVVLAAALAYGLDNLAADIATYTQSDAQKAKIAIYVVLGIMAAQAVLFWLARFFGWTKKDQKVID